MDSKRCRSEDGYFCGPDEAPGLAATLRAAMATRARVFASYHSAAADRTTVLWRPAASPQCAREYVFSVLRAAGAVSRLSIMNAGPLLEPRVVAP